MSIPQGTLGVLLWVISFYSSSLVGAFPASRVSVVQRLDSVPAGWSKQDVSSMTKTASMIKLRIQLSQPRINDFYELATKVTPNQSNSSQTSTRAHICSFLMLNFFVSKAEADCFCVTFRLPRQATSCTGNIFPGRPQTASSRPLQSRYSWFSNGSKARDWVAAWKWARLRTTLLCTQVWPRSRSSCEPSTILTVGQPFLLPFESSPVLKLSVPSGAAAGLY